MYETVVALHVLANIGAWGPLIAWPWLPRRHPDAHAARARLLGAVVSRSGTLAFLAGLYLAFDRDLFGEPWVSGPLLIMLVLFGVVGAYLTPQERRLSALAEAADWTAWEALHRRVLTAAAGCSVLVALAVYLMVVKPG